MDFLYYILSSPFAYYQFCDSVSGAVVKNLNSDKVANALFPLPPLSEQVRIEDTSYTLQDLRNLGFDEDVLGALELMTHDKNVPYIDYVAKIKGNAIAKTVKLADLSHNSDLTRLDEINEAALNRVEKYKAAIKLLSEN